MAEKKTDNAERGKGGRDGAAADVASDRIGQKLRAYYDSIRDEEIPERFLDLLERLDEAEKATKGGSKQ